MAITDIAQFYDEHFDSVYNYVYFRVRNVELAEDIVADIFMKVVERSHTYRKQRGATERSWLFAIVRNTLTDHYRKKQFHMEPVEEIDIADDKHGADVVADIGLTYRKLAPYIEELPERQREILQLKYHGGLRNKEIAQQLGIAEKSVSAALAKSLTTLRSQFATISL